MKDIIRLKNLAVDEFTSPLPIFVEATTPLSKIVAILEENKFRHLPVLENKFVIGILSDRDVYLSLSLNKDISLITAKDIMTEAPYSVDSKCPLDEVCLYMSKNKINSAVVFEDSEFYGIFTSTDAMNALIEVLRGDI